MHNRIKLLMKLFNISNTDLARLLQVDITLVSKWRNGSRSMKASQEYINRFVSYVVNLDKGNNYASLKELLHDDYYIGPSCSKEEIDLLLRDWLCSQKKKSESAVVLQEMLKSKLMKNTAQLSYWEGNDGRREAVKHFTKYAIICSPDTEIISYTTEPNAWFHEDAAFLLLWNKMIREFLAKGNVMRIVHPMNRNSWDMSNSMMKWLPLHIASDVKGYFLKQYDEEIFLNLTILTLKGEMALFNIATDQDTDVCKTWTTTNPILVGAFESVAKRALEKSVPLFKRYSLEMENCADCFKGDVMTIYAQSSTCFYYNDFSCFLPSTLEKRKELFAGAGLDAEQTDRVTKVFGLIDELKKGCRCFYIFDIETLKRHLKKDMIGMNIASLFANQHVGVSGVFFKEGVKDFFDHAMYSDNVNICIVDKGVHDDLGNLSMWSGGQNVKSFVTTHDTDRTLVLGIQEYSTAVSLFRKMETIWKSTPYLMKNKEYVVQYILDALYGDREKYETQNI